MQAGKTANLKEDIRSSEVDKLDSIRDLLYGDDRRALNDRIAHLQDRQREFEDWTRKELVRMAEEMKAQEQRLTASRRETVLQIGQHMDQLAKSVSKLSKV